MNGMWTQLNESIKSIIDHFLNGTHKTHRFPYVPVPVAVIKLFAFIHLSGHRGIKWNVGGRRLQ